MATAPKSPETKVWPSSGRLGRGEPSALCSPFGSVQHRRLRRLAPQRHRRDVVRVEEVGVLEGISRGRPAVVAHVEHLARHVVEEREILREPPRDVRFAARRKPDHDADDLVALRGVRVRRAPSLRLRVRPVGRHRCGHVRTTRLLLLRARLELGCRPIVPRAGFRGARIV
eukprot:scaffold94736_cov73-Phaeocystis_antarctica.AAC.3